MSKIVLKAFPSSSCLKPSNDDANSSHMKTDKPRTAEQHVHRPRLKHQNLIAIKPGIKCREKGGHPSFKHNDDGLMLPLTKPASLQS